MPAPAYAWLPMADVDAGARAAAAAHVERVRPDLEWAALEAAPATVPADVLEGARLLARRLDARRGTPVGVATFGEFGAQAIVRLDPDVERLLGVGRYGRPVIG